MGGEQSPPNPIPMILHKHPDKAVKAKAEKLVELAKSGSKEIIQLDSGHVLSEYDYALRQYCLTDFWFFARVPLGYHWIDEELHGKELFQHYFRPHPERKGEMFTAFDKATFIPRGHIKTLLFGVALTAWRLINKPDLRILYASATDSLAKEVGSAISGHLLNNEHLQRAFPDILPRSKAECEQWGIRGYRLPGVIDPNPSLVCASLKTNVTGKHPEIIICDDLIVPQNNNQNGWEQATEFIKTCLALLPPHGWIEILGTRYHDADPYGQILEGEIRGKQGRFKCKVLSCYVSNDPKKGPIWPAKKRWTSEIVSGYTMQQLEDMRHTMQGFFNAQMRNDPAPTEDQVIQVEDVITFSKEEEPDHGEPEMIGIDGTAGGKLIINMLHEKADELRLNLSIKEVQFKKGKIAVDGARESKTDRILTALEPIIRLGNLYIRDYMMCQSDADTDTLGYEIKRLGAARHDDQVDTLYLIEEYLIKGTPPLPGNPNELYLGCDLAFSEDRTSDYSVLMAVVVKPDGKRYVIDVDRFKLKSPSAIVDRIISFYRKHSHVSERVKRQRSRNQLRKRSFGKSYN